MTRRTAQGEPQRTSVRREVSRPVFVLRIEFAGKAEFAIHALRKLLKSLIRAHHFRVRSIEEIEGQK